MNRANKYYRQVINNIDRALKCLNNVKVVSELPYKIDYKNDLEFIKKIISDHINDRLKERGLVK